MAMLEGESFNTTKKEWVLSKNFHSSASDLWLGGIVYILQGEFT
jgi:hypothetical protein